MATETPGNDYLHSIGTGILIGMGVATGILVAFLITALVFVVLGGSP